MLRWYFSILMVVVFDLSSKAEERPNIVWINCEDLDETLGCYGDDYATSPHLDSLANDSILFRNAFANAPICAPARNCLITGMYPTSLGGQHLRCEIELPSSVEPFPKYLKKRGYFLTNYAKTDYNFSPEGIYDYWNKDLAPWRKRERSDQPFFSFIVLGTTHEGPGNRREKYEAAISGLPPEKIHDPSRAKVPPYFPDTPKMRELWARYYDLVAAMDEQVGEVLQGLKDDGLWENTIVWFFSDHGHGLPRHKRWLMDSGLRVPFILRIPAKYQHLAAGLSPGSEYVAPVSFVDFAPSVLSLVGEPLPEHMQGRAFLGANPAAPRRYVYSARDRADDMFEVSRAVHDGRYLYVRHFFPHLPYLQGGRIFGNDKESLAELRRAREAGELNRYSLTLFAERKPLEEFYDLQQDPFELVNRVNDPPMAAKVEAMRGELERWILNHRDVGFLPESEYSRRAHEHGLSVYEMAQDKSLYDLPNVLRSALGKHSGGADPGVLYWKLVRGDSQVSNPTTLKTLVQHSNPSLAVAAAELACRLGYVDFGLPTLERHVGSSDMRLSLEAARALFNAGTLASRSVDRMEAVRKSLEGDGGRRRYRDFNYASFTGWALEAALVNCGAAGWSDFD